MDSPAAKPSDITDTHISGGTQVSYRRLYEICAGLTRVSELPTLLEGILDAAIEITGADFGNVQILDRETGVLKIVAQRGFGPDFLEFFGIVHGGNSACGAALQNGQRIVVEDVSTDPIYDAESRATMLNADARACQSTPLFSRDGELFGMLSTHYRKPFRPSDIVLEFMDLLAQQAADFIERVRLHENLEREVAQRTHELSTANDNLRGLSARLLQARDEEGRRLARDLHDSVGQLLAAMSMNIATVQSTVLEPKAEKAAAENWELVSQAIIEIRTIAHLLHPPLLDEIGLVSSLQWFVEGFSNRSKIDVKLRAPETFERMAADIEIAIFRVVQEALTNVHRHSGSRTATITLEAQSDQVLVTVEDEGQGIPRGHDGNGVRPGIGIRGMRERLALSGGNLDVVSNGNGTRVQARLPLKKPTSTT